MTRACFITLAILFTSQACKAGPIHDAADDGDLEKVRSILDSDPSQLDALGRDKRTPLYIAALRGHLEIAKLLLERGADVNKPSEFSNYSPLDASVQSGEPKVVERMLSHGAKLEAKDTTFNYTALARAAGDPGDEIFERLLAAGANPDAVDDLGMHVIHRAAYGTSVHKIQLLLDRHVAVESKSKDGHSPLMCAADSGSLQVLQFLVEHGANVNSVSKYGHTALNEAMMREAKSERDWPITTILLEKGADPNVGEGTWAGPPLFGAIAQGNEKLAELLIKHGARINGFDERGRTAAHIAVFNRRAPMIKFLVDHGAKLDTPDKDGRTPLEFAIAYSSSVSPRGDASEVAAALRSYLNRPKQSEK